MNIAFSRVCPAALVVLVVLLAGCGGSARNGSSSGPSTAAVATPLRLAPIDLTDPLRQSAIAGPITLSAARNEWIDFAVEVGGATNGVSLRTPTLKSANGTALSASIGVYQALPLPVDVNRAGFVRHTGGAPAQRALPRALLPLKSQNGQIDLAALRDEEAPTDSNRKSATGQAMLWIDVQIPADAPAGRYTGACELLAGQKIVGSVPIQLTVFDFALPNERNLQIVGKLPWETLQRLYPDRFEAVRPRLLNRKDNRYAAAIQRLDQMVAVAQRNRTEVVFPRLQPTVKWPANEPPQVDWSDFDSVVSPWMTGEAFPDKTPLGYWPLPSPDQLETYDRNSQTQYWSQAASHFDQHEWLGRSSVWVDRPNTGRLRAADALELSALAAELTALHPQLRVTLPLEDDQLQLSERGLIDTSVTSRLWTVGTGLVFAPPAQPWPNGVTRPDHWLRTDVPGLVPYVGAGGDERDVRLWAWLAYLRSPNVPREESLASHPPRPMIVWNDVLPSYDQPKQPADPNELTWFYPGEWFGVDEPLASVQLKWLRRAQQDFEYLWLAGERGETITALLMARLITKPVEIQPGQSPDPTYALMSGTTDPQAWADARQLLAATILLHAPGKPVDPQRQQALYIETLRWLEPLERPLLTARAAQWGLQHKDGRDTLQLRLGLDIYNASDSRPDRNTLQWTSMPFGWQVDPRPTSIAALATYRVKRETLDAAFDPARLSAATRKPIEVAFTNGFNNQTQKLQFVLPVAACDRREGRMQIDGQLSEQEWHELDLAHDGPLVRLMSRPDLQKQQLHLSASRSRIYTGWAERNFYVAFDLQGLSPSSGGAAQNFVAYQFRRAWGEDLCELLIQPVDEEGKAGAVLHVVCKPNGSTWVERRAEHDPAWQEVAAKVPYSARIDGSNWRGEVAIPWEAILGSSTKAPPLLRFNLVQHRSDAGESASWCGPIDFGRDDSFMGVLMLRDPEAAKLGVIGLQR